MKNKIYILLLGIAMISASCNDFLDLKPHGIVIPEAFEDYQKLINYSGVLKASDSYPNYMTDDALMPGGDDISDGELADVPTRNLVTFQSEIYGQGESDYFWEGSYNRIYYYNVIIEDVMAVTDATETEKKSLQAEALMGRAFEYLVLVNAYGNHYDKKTAATDLGIPLMLDKQINKSNLKRATVQQVYDQITKDLDSATLYLPEKPKGTAYRASKSVGLGMLARMSFYQGDYAKVLSYAEQSLAINSTILDLKQFKVVDPDKSIGRTDYPSQAADNPEHIYIRLAPYVFGMSGSVLVSDELIALYDENPGDMREVLFMSKYYGGTFYDNYVWMPFVYANMAMSVPEIMLMAAECEARIGSKEKAMDYLNRLMDNRINDFTPQSAASNDEALVKVLKERRRELAMTGCTRLIDLKRLNREPRFAKTITHVVEGKTYTLEPNSPKYILPIPLNVLNFNPEMLPNVR